MTVLNTFYLIMNIIMFVINWRFYLVTQRSIMEESKLLEECKKSIQRSEEIDKDTRKLLEKIRSHQN